MNEELLKEYGPDKELQDDASQKDPGRMSLIFDSHAHYDDKAFDEDRDELLSSLAENGVGYVVDVSAAPADMEKVLDLAHRYDFVYASAGIHPSETPDFTDDNLLLVSNMLADEKCVAVGEIGLDYHYDDTCKPLQKQWFAAQIALAVKEKYPIIIHSRDAAADTLDIVKSENARDAGGVVHCFSYEKEMAARYLDLGFYIGIGGVLTFKNSRKLKEIAAYMPLDRILLETDCPYLAPHPFRGGRNDSTLIKYIVEELSGIKNIKPEEIIHATTENACRMYGI